MKIPFLKVPKRYLMFRENAQYLRDIIRKQVKNEKIKILALDFSEVRFFSRSFIDEFLNILEDFKKNKLKIKIVNLAPKLEKFLWQIKKRKEKIRKEMK